MVISRAMLNASADITLIYCDGACSGNPGPGGWAAIVATPDGKVTELGGAAAHTTNNQMELTAATEGLKAVAHVSGPVRVYTDSTYVIRGITQWIWGWQKRGWQSSQGSDVANREYWEALLAVTKARGTRGKIDWQYVQGHAGIPGNDRVDAIAVAFSKREPVSLYAGDHSGYTITLEPVAAEGSAKRPSKTKKGQAYSYLSLLDAVPMRHSSWAECEQRVKKQSGAKFKKAMSAAEELEILRAWGVDPKALS